MGGSDEKVHYKIGDLGHVASVWGGFMAPEEGDCRYMAPELLQMEVCNLIILYSFMFSMKTNSMNDYFRSYLKNI